MQEKLKGAIDEKVYEAIERKERSKDRSKDKQGKKL